MTVTSLAAPALTVPIVQVTVVVPEQVPWVAAADTSVTPGRERVRDAHRRRGARPGVVDRERVGESSPTRTGSGESVCVTLTSAIGLTVVGALAGLLAALGSAVVDETVAVFVTLGAAPAPAVATIVTVTSLAAPALTVPIVQLIVVVPEQVPCVELADTSVRPAGSGSETLTAAAGLGPLLWTVRV